MHNPHVMKIVSVGLSWALMYIVPGVVSAVTTIACLGDSITAGSGASDKASTSYPPMLQQYLNEHRPGQYECINYGVGGKTVQKMGKADNGDPFSYWDAKAFKAVIKKSEEEVPDVVIMQFGTNDAKTQNWDEAMFMKDYTALINIFKEMNPTPKIYICIPPPLYRPFSKIRHDIVNQSLGRVIEAIGKRNEVQVVDWFKHLGGAALSRPHLFMTHSKELKWPNDGCHPNDIGYRVIARILCSKILGEKYKGISPDIDTEEDGADESMKSRLEVALEKDRKQLGYDYRAP